MFETALGTVDWTQVLETPTIIFIVGGLVGLAAVIAPQWRKARQSEDEARLKEQMIQRGFSAAEIERVIRSGLNEESDDSKKTAGYASELS